MRIVHSDTNITTTNIIILLKGVPTVFSVQLQVYTHYNGCGTSYGTTVATELSAAVHIHITDQRVPSAAALCELVECVSCMKRKYAHTIPATGSVNVIIRIIMSEATWTSS